MPQFIMDTSGEVGGVNLIRWGDLDAFTQGYIEALFFTSDLDGADIEESSATEHPELDDDD